MTALKTFYLWAREDGHVAEVPFRRKTVWTLPNRGGRRPVEVLAGNVRAGQSPARIRFLTRDQYVAFRTVGLLGRLPDGGEDPAWSGRNGARDAAFADLLVHSGARVAEAASLLVPELPAPSGDTVTLRLAAPTTKGAKGREVVFATGCCGRSTTTSGWSGPTWWRARSGGRCPPTRWWPALSGPASPARSRSSSEPSCFGDVPRAIVVASPAAATWWPASAAATEGSGRRPAPSPRPRSSAGGA